MGTAGKDPLLYDIPEQLESQRLIIRAPLFGDGPIVNEAMKESLDELRPWMIWAQQLQTPEETESYIRDARIHYLKRSGLTFLFFHKERGHYLGNSSLHAINWHNRSFEIGYWIRSSEQGRGYVTEMVNAITQFAINELQANRISIRCDERNIKSANVARRAGFTYEGTMRNDTVDWNDELCSTMLFSKVRGVEF